MQSGGSRDRVALVTGGGRGIGRAIALELAGRGYSLALVARTFDELRETRALSSLAPADCLLILADLAQAESPNEIFDASLEHFGRIDLLVNNAGWAPPRSDLTKTSGDEIDRMLALNLRAPIALTQLALQHMTARGNGVIVNIASKAGLSAPPRETVYAASKAGLIAFSRACGAELRGSGIRIGLVIPGLTDTSLIPQNKRLDRSAMLRPEEVAEAVMKIVFSEAAEEPTEILIEPQINPERQGRSMQSKKTLN